MWQYPIARVVRREPVDGYRRLVIAVAAQWIKDARFSRADLVSLAEWTETPVDVLEARIRRLRAAGSQWRVD